MGFTEDDLKKMGLEKQPDNTWSKPRREHPAKRSLSSSSASPEQLSFISQTPIASTDKKLIDSPITMRKITLKLFGVPMPKQSVKQGRNKKTKEKVFYQPEKLTERIKDYQRQIKKQLSKDFELFETEVHVKKIHYIFPPLKSFHKIKGRMDALRNGKIFYKNTRPDAVDNLAKIIFDSMSNLVYTDDSIVVTLNDIAKYYGVGGCIIIELEGY